MAQDNETSGLPIGPDTSLVLAEVLLTPIDEIITHEPKPLGAHRYFDDYELVYDTRADAEQALSRLHSLLQEYNLTLNSQKTTIVELPTNNENPWVRELRRFELPADRQASPQIVHDFFDLSLQTQQRFPEQLVLLYAVGRFEAVIRERPESWSVLHSILLQLLRAVPVTAPAVVSLLVVARRAGASIDLMPFAECLNAVVAHAAPLSFSSEACWALWALAAFDLSVANETVAALEKSPDPTAALLALYLQDKGNTKRSLDFSRWSSELTPDGLRGESWLLVYEGMRRGYLKRGAEASALTHEPFYEFLDKAACSFLSDISEDQEGPDRHDLDGYDSAGSDGENDPADADVDDESDDEDEDGGSDDD